MSPSDVTSGPKVPQPDERNVSHAVRFLKLILLTIFWSAVTLAGIVFLISGLTSGNVFTVLLGIALVAAVVAQMVRIHLRSLRDRQAAVGPEPDIQLRTEAEDGWAYYVSKLYYLVLGVFVLLAWLAGIINFQFAVICAIALIGYGVFAIRRAFLARHADVVQSLLNEAIDAFLQGTYSRWSEGQLAELSQGYARLAGPTFNGFKKLMRPVVGTSLHALYTQCQLKPDEFLIAMYETSSATTSGQFVLTNHRLLQRDGSNGQFKEVALADVESFERTGWWTGELQFVMQSGNHLRLSKLKAMPAERTLKWALRRFNS